MGEAHWRTSQKRRQSSEGGFLVKKRTFGEAQDLTATGSAGPKKTQTSFQPNHQGISQILATPDICQPHAGKNEGHQRHTTYSSCPHRAYHLFDRPSILTGVARLTVSLHTQQQLLLSTSTASASLPTRKLVDSHYRRRDANAHQIGIRDSPHF